MVSVQSARAEKGNCSGNFHSPVCAVANVQYALRSTPCTPKKESNQEEDHFPVLVVCCTLPALVCLAWLRGNNKKKKKKKEMDNVLAALELAFQPDREQREGGERQLAALANGDQGFFKKMKKKNQKEEEKGPPHSLFHHLAHTDTDTHTHRHTDTDTQTHRHRHRHRHRHTHTHTIVCPCYQCEPLHRVCWITLCHCGKRAACRQLEAACSYGAQTEHSHKVGPRLSSLPSSWCFARGKLLTSCQPRIFFLPLVCAPL